VNFCSSIIAGGLLHNNVGLFGAALLMRICAACICSKLRITGLRLSMLSMVRNSIISLANVKNLGGTSVIRGRRR